MNTARSLYWTLLFGFLFSTFFSALPARAQKHDHHDGCMIEQDAPVNYAVVAGMRKYGGKKISAEALSLPAPTVGSVVGKTAVAVFYMEIDEGGNLAPYWTPTLTEQVRGNIRKNCDWWEELGRNYGKEVDLQVVEYGVEDDLTLLNYDPTRTTTPGEFIKDRSFYDTVMNRLGYTSGTSAEKMTAFCQDLAVMKGADQAFVVWLIVGANAVRSNASFNGPSTNIWHKVAQTGWTTAHEMGHIFGAFDEYYEDGTEYARSRQSRNGAPNANLDFRNHPVVPCMMSSSFNQGICSYTAVHVGLTNRVLLTRVESEYPLGIYDVRYWDSDLGTGGAFVATADRYQGTTFFPWGAGMRVQITGGENVADDDFTLLVNPTWEGSGRNVVDYLVDTVDPGLLKLGYTPSESVGEYRIEYLSPDEGPMGAYVYGMIPLGSRRAAIASRDGISIYDQSLDTLRKVIDYPFANSRDGGPRQGFSIAIDTDSTIWFGTQNNEIVRWKNDTASRLVGPVAGVDYRALAVTSNGDVWAGYEAGLHRFGNGSDAQVTSYSSARDPLLGETVWTLAADKQGGLWIGSRGRRDQGSSGGGLQYYDPESNTWTDYTAEIAGETVNAITLWGDTVAVATSNGFTLYDGTQWKHYDPGTDFTKNVMMVGRDGKGNLVLATFGGLYRMTDGRIWERLTVENSLIPQNLCTTVALGPDGTIWSGTVDGTIALINFNTGVSSVVDISHQSEIGTLTVAPNPAVESLTMSLQLSTAEQGTLLVYDAIGRRRARFLGQNLSAGIHTFHLPTDNLENGVYHVAFRTEQRTIWTSVIVQGRGE